MDSGDGVAIVGIGMHRFGRTEGVSGRQQGAVAVRAALADAGISWENVQVAAGGSMSAGAADTLVSDLGLTGLTFINVTNGCATGGSALTVAADAITSGSADIAMAIGFDKHDRGAFNADPADWGLEPWYGRIGLMLTTQFFALKTQRYLYEHDLDASLLSQLAARAFRNGSLNDMAWRRKPLSAEDIAGSAMISDPLTQYMLCSPGEGGVALVLCRANLARRYTDRPIYLRAVATRTRRYGSFEVFSPWLSPQRGPGPTEDAARAAFEQAGVDPREVAVAQLQDTDAGSELIHMAETGLCEHGRQAELIASGRTELDGTLPVNTDGGCLAMGEPIGASGLRQVYETVLQLRGDAGQRQVRGQPAVGFTHVYGAPGVSACTVLTR
ncbi:thiolase family protein [Mycolicibacterium porcinum]|uniref:Thiolase family protein n=1 Tax=Mycolicibacterium porcinum TaxID=39693 RepID=A0AAW5SUB6_9MYCO|nr:thiolase family protein [Mycolicibacterium porcinum]MCV7386476.1 thiolase family protein [Mycolicibacterium porcinum]ORB39030.1 acetyl-CoA acetyltransferase [Mycolicibacterium porcinum]CDO30854.1 thiolase [Mycolicibacterium vulneris]